MIVTHRAGPSDRSRPNATVLVVEDDALLRFTLAAEIRDAGFHVVEAANAAEAETALESLGPVDLVVTDIQMPGPNDGLALARIIRNSRPETKVIVASGVAPKSGAVGVADAFFGKPYDFETLITRIRRLLAEVQQA